MSSARSQVDEAHRIQFGGPFFILVMLRNRVRLPLVIICDQCQSIPLSQTRKSSFICLTASRSGRYQSCSMWLPQMQAPTGLHAVMPREFLKLIGRTQHDRSPPRWQSRRTLLNIRTGQRFCSDLQSYTDLQSCTGQQFCSDVSKTRYL